MIQAPQSTIDGTHEREYSSSENINNVPRRRRTMLESGDVTKLASAQHVVCDTHARRVVCKRISRSHRFNDVCRRHESTWISLHLLAKLEEFVVVGARVIGASCKENFIIRDARHEFEVTRVVETSVQQEVQVQR